MSSSSSIRKSSRDPCQERKLLSRKIQKAESIVPTESLSKKIEDAEKDKTETKTKIAEIAAEIKQKKDYNDRLIKVNVDFIETNQLYIKRLLDESSNLKLSDNANEIRHREKKIEDLKKEIEEREKKIEEREKNLRKDINDLKKENAILESELIDYKETLDILKLSQDNQLDQMIAVWKLQLLNLDDFDLYSMAPSRITDEKWKEKELVGTPLMSKELWDLYCHVMSIPDSVSPDLITATSRILNLFKNPLGYFDESDSEKDSGKECLINAVMSHLISCLFNKDEIEIFSRSPMPALKGATGQMDFLVHVVTKNNKHVYPCFFELKYHSALPYPQMSGYACYLVKKAISHPLPFVLGVLLTESKVELYAYQNANKISSGVSQIYRTLLFSEESYTDDHLRRVIDAIIYFSNKMKWWDSNATIISPYSCRRVLHVHQMVYKAYKSRYESRELAMELYTRYLNASPHSETGECTIIKYPYVPGEHYPSNVNQAKGLIRALNFFHEDGKYEGKLCHGDIRAYNVLFDESAVKLIDFDFSGKSDTASYPQGYNSDIRDGGRHSLAKEGTRLQQVHDWYAVFKIFELMEPTEKNPEILEKWELFLKEFRERFTAKENPNEEDFVYILSSFDCDLKNKKSDTNKEIGTNSPPGLKKN